jgi:hypothetical protein
MSGGARRKDDVTSYLQGATMIGKGPEIVNAEDWITNVDMLISMRPAMIET